MNGDGAADGWTVAEAKARLSELIEKARHHGPQAITRHGKRAVIVVDAGLWDETQKRERRGSFADFLLKSPLNGSDLEITRLEGGVRDFNL